MIGSTDISAAVPATAIASARHGSQIDHRLGFGDALDASRADRAPEDKARTAAEDFVASALIQPILKQLRESNNAVEPFAPGDAERTFGAMWDTEIASRIVGASQFPLVDSIARQLSAMTPSFHEAAAPPTDGARNQ